VDLEKRIAKEVDELKKFFPKLNHIEKEKRFYKLKGEIEIIDPDDGKIWETYKVEILIKDTYPAELPVLFEKEDKIKHHKNRDGSCCLAPRVEEYLILGREFNLCDYLQKLVIPILAAHKLVSLGEEWPNGEYAHEGKGIIQYYKGRFETNEILIILKCLRILSGKFKINRNKLCLCGSTKKYKFCHGKVLEKFGMINRVVFQNDLRDIETELKK